KFSDGSETKTLVVEEGKSISLEDYTTIERKGYVLNGWSSEKNPKYSEIGLDWEYDPSWYTGATQTVYANWYKACVITLNANGGKFSNGKTTMIASQGTHGIVDINMAETPIKTGYTCLGWNRNSKAKERELFGSFWQPTEDMTFYAVWVKTYTITLDGNGGKFGSAKTKKVTSDPELSSVDLGDYTPTRSGYHLKGWSAKKSGNAEYDPDGYYTPTKNSTLYAIWGKEVTITLDANGGTFPKGASTNGTTSLSSNRQKMTVKVAQGDSLYLYSDSIPTKSKVVLLGWGTSKSRDSITDIETTANKTYYALWQTGITVTLKATGNLSFDYEKKVTSMTVSAAKGDTLEDYVPTVYIYKSGGSFLDYVSSANLKWSTSKSAKNVNRFRADNYKITKSVTLYVFNDQSVKITWHANGGKINGKNSYSETVAFGSYVYERFYKRLEPLKSGSVFIGWSTTKKASGLIDFENGVQALKNTTYYAIWESGYKITINGNGGTFTNYSGGTLSKDAKTLTAYVRKGKSLGSITFSVTKSGKELTELSLSAKGKAISNRESYYPTGNMKLYAVSADSISGYNITFNANGGKFQEDSSTKKTVFVDKNSWTYPYVYRTGYAFLGWYTQKSGGKEVSSATKKMSVYAHWKKCLKITWYANGGTLTNGGYQPKDTTYVLKNSYIETNNLDQGHAQAYSSSNDKGFVGWSTSKKGAIIDINNYKVTKNVSFYAIWKSGDDLADGRIELSKKRYAYAGKAVRPTISVYDRAGKKVSESQYSVSYERNNGAGEAFIVVQGKGKKSGTLRKSFYINYDARSNVKTAKASGKNIKITYSKAVYAAEYRVYAVNKDTGAVKSVSSKSTNATIKGLSKGTYSVYVIPYAISGEGDEWVEASGRGAGTIKTVTVK
ncbi:MAG: InlB B-repeat-containing protein, partial [Lachnospiraceae bacterium]|nr:InlB B-repeat-containing protein [Lachnospiraceae bacterium]